MIRPALALPLVGTSVSPRRFSTGRPYSSRIGQTHTKRPLSTVAAEKRPPIWRLAFAAFLITGGIVIGVPFAHAQSPDTQAPEPQPPGARPIAEAAESTTDRQTIELLEADLPPDLSANLERDWHIEAERQMEAEQFDNAQSILEGGIQELEDELHRYHKELVTPLTMLGDSQYLQGDYPGAASSYQRAIHVNRVNDGLHSAEQVPIVYKEAQTYKAMGEYSTANDREEYAYSIMLRSFGAYDQRLLSGLFHLARWYEQTNNIFLARGLYQHAVHLIEAQFQEQSPEMIDALTGLSRSYRLERFPPIYLGDLSDSEEATAFRNASSTTRAGVVVVNNFSAGERTLQRLIRIHREAPEPDEMVVSESILDLADWYLLFKKSSRAADLYEHVYNALNDIEDVDAVSYFSEPKLLHYPKPKNPTLEPGHDDQSTQPGHVELAFDVSANGIVSNVKTVSSVPADVMDFRVRRSIRYARYRPALLDGTPTTVRGHEYRWEFPYIPADGQSTEQPNNPSDTEATKKPAPETASLSDPDTTSADTATIQDH